MACEHPETFVCDRNADAKQPEYLQTWTYPNPAGNVIILDPGILRVNTNYISTDTCGKLVKQGHAEGQIINISDIACGLYFRLIHYGEDWFTEKIIVINN